MMIGSCSITVAELWGLYQGLQLAWNSGIRRLKVETDSLCVTQLVARPSVMTNDYAPLVQAIKNYLKLDWHVSISHIYREANFTADYMANLVFSLPLGLLAYPTPFGCSVSFASWLLRNFLPSFCSSLALFRAPVQ